METKWGPKTTEFWVVIFTMILNFLNITGVWDFTTNGVSAWIMAIIGGLYAVSRGIAKNDVKPDA